MKIPTKRKIINAYLEEHYIGVELSVYACRVKYPNNNYYSVIGGRKKVVVASPEDIQEFTVKIKKITWYRGDSYRIEFDPIEYYGQKFNIVYVNSRFE